MPINKTLVGEIGPRQQKVVQAVLQHAATRRIPVGGRLPSIREIASDIGIAHATIAKAMTYLSNNGIVASQGRNGTILLKEVEKNTQRKVQRLILLYSTGGNEVANITAAQIDFGLRLALKALMPGLEVSSIIHSPQDGPKFLEDLIRYHTQVGRSEDTVFLLGNCPFSVKKLFQDKGVPSIIIGGKEPGITIPNITFDIEASVRKVLRIVHDADAYPAAFIYDVEVLIGEQIELAKLFSEAAERMDCGSDKIMICRASSVPDVFKGQLTHFLKSNEPPKTLITRCDESALRAARVCAELGLQKRIKIISLSSVTVGEWFMPSVTGLIRDHYAIAQAVLDYAGDVCAGVEIKEPQKILETVMVFRDTFPNPYLQSGQTSA